MLQNVVSAAVTVTVSNSFRNLGPPMLVRALHFPDLSAAALQGISFNFLMLRNLPRLGPVATARSSLQGNLGL